MPEYMVEFWRTLENGHQQLICRYLCETITATISIAIPSAATSRRIYVLIEEVKL